MMEIYNFFDIDYLDNVETDPPPQTVQPTPSNNSSIIATSQQFNNLSLNNPLLTTTPTTSTQLPQPSSRPKTKFTKLEDEIIIRFVKENGAHSWNRIIPLLPGRTPRLVRERWVNYLSPDVNLTPFTKEEDDLINELVNKHGKHWKFISQFFNKRTDIALKNRFMLLQRREKANHLKQQRMTEQQQQQNQQNISYSSVLSQPLNTFTTIQPPSNDYPPPCLPKLSDENSNLDLNTDTESFPTLDDAVVCCSEWDIDSYQYDDLSLLCNFQFEF